MEYTKLGNTGLDVSRLCLGCMSFGDAKQWIHPWLLNEKNSRPIIKKALDMGINFLIQRILMQEEQVKKSSDKL